MMKYGKTIGISASLSILLTIFSYFKNNAGVCCDLIFAAGWPWPFYGGSGGFLGISEDRILPAGLILDLLFWFGISLVMLLLIERRKKI